jgi:branched-chain amino acid transport system ATP-binding protein
LLFTMENVHGYYGSSHILQGVSLELDRGEMVALLGRNGVGKSTTLKTIVGLVKPSGGAIRFKGERIDGKSTHAIVKSGIGYVPEERAVFNSLTVHQNLLMGMKHGRGVKRPADGGWSLERIYGTFQSLKARESNKGSQLSGGEQQMLTMARTLMGNPELLLVDEPTEGLAPLIRKTVADTLRQINASGVSVLVVEQNLKFVLPICSRAYIMTKGEIVYSGSSQDLIEEREIQEKYLEV